MKICPYTFNKIVRANLPYPVHIRRGDHPLALVIEKRDPFILCPVLSVVRWFKVDNTICRSTLSIKLIGILSKLSWRYYYGNILGQSDWNKYHRDGERVSLFKYFYFLILKG